jgi:pyruvate/2-oxoacid:ferredoxin oxidoreductase alpha subunit
MLGCGAHGLGAGFVELRRKHLAAMERAKQNFDAIDAAYTRSFRRGYGGQIETYRVEDADVVLVTSGSVAGTARTVIDAKREQGIRAGLLRIRMYRPFPKERLAQVLSGRKAIAVLDRSVAFGWDCGPMHQEVQALAAQIGCPPILGFIDGLANMDITKDHIERIVDEVQAAARGNTIREVTWLAAGE